MAQAPLTPIQMETAAQAITISMLGLPAPTNVAPPAQDPSYFAVRVGWQQQGQPFQTIDQDVTYVMADEVDDPYNRVKDVSYSQTTVVDQDENIVTTLTKTTNYTRIWEIMWCSYGPNSFDNSRLLRTRLFDQDVKDAFANWQLYFVTDPAAPRRVPEEKDGQWWERTDFTCRFNEFVTELRSEDFITSAELVVYDAEGNLISDQVGTDSGWGVGPYGGGGFGS